MKKLILILCFLLIPITAFAFGSGLAGSGDLVSYLLSENADGGVECTTGGILNCQKTWTAQSTIFTPNYTPAIEGVYSFLLDTAITTCTLDSPGFAETGTVYGYFMIKPTTWTGATARAFCVLRDINEIDQFKIKKVANSGALSIQHGTLVSADSVTVLDTSNVFHIWFDYTKGTGSNGIANLYINTNATKPASPERTLTTGTATALIKINRFWSVANETDFVFDHIRLDDVDIGSNPQ